MARGPFQGTFQPNFRPTVVTAPDAIVYLNGEQDVIGCPSCKRKFDFSKYITQIQVDLSVDSVPGSANVTMSVPRHEIEDFYFDGVPMISPMMEIEIFAKGYYLLEGIPQYYPIFWGIVTEVSDSYSAGEHTVTINCADILKWWEICRMNINPAFTAPAGQSGRSIFGNVLFGTNPYDTIMTLAQMAFGDVILGTGSLITLRKETEQTKTFTAVLGDVMQYWSSRFSRIRSSLLLYGVNGIAVRGDSLAQAYDKGKFTQSNPHVASTAVRNANGGSNASQLIFDPTDPGVTAFKTQFSQAGQVNFWQAEYQTKLEIANTCKEALGFEFFMDVTGDIVFKPPFYNLDIIANKPVSWIQDIDIIDWNFSDSEAEVVTQMTMQGNFGGNIDYGLGEESTPTSSVTDYHLLRKYGWRPHSYNSEWMSDPTMMYYHGMDIMDRLNSRRHQATINIPLRPELRLGFPVYVAPKDQVWYLKGISHNISFGGRATTTLSLTARRQKFIGIKGMATLKTTGDLSDRAFQVAKAKFDKLAASGKAKGSPPKPPPAKKDNVNPGPPTIKGLAQKAFTLEMGDAATVPPINVNPEDRKTTEPYEPLILRHPKNGKIVGHPNVVMVYARPMDQATFDKANDGQKEPGTNKFVKVKEAPKVNKTQQEAKVKEGLARADEKLVAHQKKHSENRYQYGINSAGVFVYAHDVSGDITQFALIPSANITATGVEKSPIPNGNAMVRPVSDARGFEVVGHFRYGRGVALRDGSLVLNEDEPGKANKRLKGGEGVDLQTALSGNLFAMLNAQSQGLTSITSAYANPADALARMLPEDYQTAAVLTPGGTVGDRPAQFSATEEKFIDVVPLGSPGYKGNAASVEASQFSRALTLTEMSIRSADAPGDPDCDCQIGRADLAFINVGYQFRNISAASPDTSELFGQDVHGETGETPNFNKPQDPALKFANIKDRVDEFLWNLYKTLDDVHQPYEKSLRGDATGQDSGLQKPLPDLFTGREGDSGQSDFAPPFGSMNRSGLGDPIATAQQGSSAASDLKKAFSSFGDNIKKNAKKAGLAQEITNLAGLIDRLNKRLTAVERENTPGNTTTGNTDSAESLRRQIAQAQQDLAHKQAEIAQLG
jgi:hypothetical protein